MIAKAEKSRVGPGVQFNGFREVLFEINEKYPSHVYRKAKDRLWKMCRLSKHDKQAEDLLERLHENWNPERHGTIQSSVAVTFILDEISAYLNADLNQNKRSMEVIADSWREKLGLLPSEKEEIEKTKSNRVIGLFTKKRSSGEEIVHEAKSWIKFEAAIAMSRLIYVAASKSIGFGASVDAEALPALWVAGSVVKELHHATMGLAGVFVAEKCLEKCMDVYGASHAPAEIARKAQYLPLLPAIVKSKNAAEKTYFDLSKESFDLLDSVTRASPASTRFTEHIRKNINTDTLVAGVQALIEASGCEESPKKTVAWLRAHPKEGSRVFRRAVRKPRKEVRRSNQEKAHPGAGEPKVSSSSAQKITTTDMLRIVKKKRQAERKSVSRAGLAKQAAM